MPAVVAFQVYDPFGEAAFEVLPALSFYWTNNPMVQMTMPVGTPYYGNEVRPPASVVQVFQELVIPRYRGQYGGLRVLSIEPLPEFAQQVREATVVSSPMEQVRVEAAKARLHYQAGDQALEEDLRGVVKVHSTAMPVFMDSIEHIFWSADYLFAARAADGQLDGLADLFQTMISSLRLNPQWFMRYQQCQQALIRGEIHHIAQIGQVSRYISQ
jgi:ABC-type transporter Mla MlaB component